MPWSKLATAPLPRHGKNRATHVPSEARRSARSDKCSGCLPIEMESGNLRVVSLLSLEKCLCYTLGHQSCGVTYIINEVEVVRVCFPVARKSHGLEERLAAILVVDHQLELRPAVLLAWRRKKARKEGRKPMNGLPFISRAWHTPTCNGFAHKYRRCKAHGNSPTRFLRLLTHFDDWQIRHIREKAVHDGVRI